MDIDQISQSTESRSGTKDRPGRDDDVIGDTTSASCGDSIGTAVSSDAEGPFCSGLPRTLKAQQHGRSPESWNDLSEALDFNELGTTLRHRLPRNLKVDVRKSWSDLSEGLLPATLCGVTEEQSISPTEYRGDMSPSSPVSPASPGMSGSPKSKSAKRALRRRRCRLKSEQDSMDFGVNMDNSKNGIEGKEGIDFPINSASLNASNDASTLPVANSAYALPAAAKSVALGTNNCSRAMNRGVVTISDIGLDTGVCSQQPPASPCPRSPVASWSTGGGRLRMSSGAGPAFPQPCASPTAVRQWRADCGSWPLGPLLSPASPCRARPWGAHGVVSTDPCSPPTSPTGHDASSRAIPTSNRTPVLRAPPTKSLRAVFGPSLQSQTCGDKAAPPQQSVVATSPVPPTSNSWNSATSPEVDILRSMFGETGLDSAEVMAARLRAAAPEAYED